ncbi:MAG TPA: DUF1328 family protein [Beijerinckia sp.]|jgi:uncharacterized membrane protein YtjA (UPF0391 family)|nr:DUF1328 family protein [Beijerinckia sp.]
MLKGALIFFSISLLAGALGFTNIADPAGGVARKLFFIFVAIFIIFFELSLLAGETIL